MQIVRINAKIIQDDSGVFTEIPVLLDENQDVIKPLMEYTLKLKRDGMSQSTILNCIKATQLLLEYMSANTSGFQNPESLFENFTSRLYTGTIGDDGLDPSGLYWLPCSKQVSKLYINALTKLTDWLALNNNGNAINPLVEANTSTKRLKYAA